MIDDVLNGNTVADLEIDFGFTVQNNVINGNGQYGIFVLEKFEPVPSSEVINNTPLANGMFDLFEGSNFFSSSLDERVARQQILHV